MKRIFLPEANKIKLPKENSFIRMNVFDEYGDSEENRQIRESMEEQEQREEQKRFNEMDITVRVGYPFKQTVHYTAGESNRKHSI